MTQKNKKEGEKSPTDKTMNVLLSPDVEQSSVSAAGFPPSSLAAITQEVGGNGGTENLSASEILELEQQKLAGKKKGQFFSFSSPTTHTTYIQPGVRSIFFPMQVQTR